MKTIATRSLLIGILAAAFGCSAPSQRAVAKATYEDLQGKWKPVGTVARYEIQIKDKRLTIKAHSSDTGKKMEISDVSWDGEFLKFTSYMRHTNWKIHYINRLIDSETMDSSTTGSNKEEGLQSRFKWKKY